MLHCCNLSLTRVIVIIVLFQCKGGGLGEELVESADYPGGFGSLVFVIALDFRACVALLKLFCMILLLLYYVHKDRHDFCGCGGTLTG